MRGVRAVTRRGDDGMLQSQGVQGRRRDPPREIEADADLGPVRRRQVDRVA